jgi:hypothetical protein
VQVQVVEVFSVANKQDQGLDNAALDQETAVPLPERDAMSLIDPGIGKVALSSFTLPVDPEPIDPPIGVQPPANPPAPE